MKKLSRDFSGLTKDQVVLTNGVDEGIHLICEAYLREEDEAILVVPTFGMYAIYIHATGAKIVTIPMHADFSFPIERDRRRGHTAYSHDRSRESQ